MKKLRFIVSQPADGMTNMAIDEALFNGKVRSPSSLPIVRIYTWASPCITVGYFQKHADFAGYGIKITRRMTGGLSVVHGNDVSFSFILDDSSWEHVYDQEKTYELIHSGIQTALSACGIVSQFVKQKPSGGGDSLKGNICVQTLYPNDLCVQNKKIVGSCQRRRGRALMVQGSVHLPRSVDRQKFYDAWKISLKDQLGAEIFVDQISSTESSEAEAISKTRYSDPGWNQKY